MVKTRSGHDVFYTEASYGRAARQETSRRLQKRKLSSAASVQDKDGAKNGTGASTPTTARRTRGRIRQEEDLATPPSASTRVGVTPPSRSVRILRGRTPTCSDFGISRHYSFQGNGFFFCHACDLWDSRPPDHRNKSDSRTKRLACTAKHTSFSHPTMFRKEFCRREPILSVLITNDDSDSTSSTSTGTDVFEDEENEEGDGDNNGDDAPRPRLFSDTDSQPAHQQNDEDQSEQLKGKVALLRKKLQEMTRRNKVLAVALAKKSRSDDGRDDNEQGDIYSLSNNENFKSQVIDAINNVSVSQTRWSTKRTGTLVAQAVWAHVGCLPELLKLSRKHFREKIFTPFNILREMDLAGGTLSYEGIDVLRRVESGGHQRMRGCMIPSKSEIKRMAGMVEWFARPLCPFTLTTTSKGESVEFDYAKTTLCILRAFHLDEVGKTRSLSIASSIDGASLSKNLSIIAWGIKVTDRAARCPLTSKPLLDNPTTMKAQSRNLCIPLKIMMGRETKETFTEFGPLFQFIDNLSATETLPMEMADFEPFRCMINCDLSAQWKGLCKGGAAKVHTLPCTGCATESESLATPNNVLCARWCSERSLDANWMCFHKPMGTPEHVATMKTEVAELITAMHCDLEVVQARSTISSHDVEFDNQLQSSTRNATSIHFVPTNTWEKQLFSRLLSDELMLRGLHMSGSMECRRRTLREALRGEATAVARLAKEIAHGDVKEGAYFLLMHTLPCVLHMENRNGIKLLTMVIIEGLSNAKKKSLYCGVNAEGTRVSRFVSDIEIIINTSILGSEDDPCQWMCPFDTKKKEVAPITMDNVRTRRIVDAMDTLVDFCVVDKERASLWVTALNNYRTAMVLLRRKRHDFTNTEIASYQSHADLFFQAWMKLWQKEGVTNYIHMIGSGHVSDYLYRWKNLYRYSQQGWEAMNSLIKTFFFRRTSHGGGVRGKSKKSRLVPIARWLQRRIVFLCRINEDSIRQYAQTHPMPKVFRTQDNSGEDDDVYE